jgi:recombination protein RecT
MTRSNLPTVSNKKELQDLMDRPDVKVSLKKILPKHMDLDRFERTAILAFSKNPKLYQCTKMSVLRSIGTAGELGLDCSGTTGQAYLVPYKNQCTLIPGYQGLLELVYRTGRIDGVDAQVVYENDHFVFRLGTDPHLEHVPAMENRGEMKAVYAVAHIKGANHPKIEFMTKEDVDKIRNRSRASGDGPWCTDYTEMARKTVLRRIFKTLPKSSEVEPLRRAMAIDNEQYERRSVASRTVDGTDGASGVKIVEDLLSGDPHPPAESEPQGAPEDADNEVLSDEYTQLDGLEPDIAGEPDLPESGPDTDPTPEGTTGLSFRYQCKNPNCQIGFDKAKIKGEGGAQTAICPKCKSGNIVDTMPV